MKNLILALALAVSLPAVSHAGCDASPSKFWVMAIDGGVCKIETFGKAGAKIAQSPTCPLRYDFTKAGDSLYINPVTCAISGKVFVTEDTTKTLIGLASGDIIVGVVDGRTPFTIFKDKTRFESQFK